MARSKTSKTASIAVPAVQTDAGLHTEVADSVSELARRGGITDERAFAAWYAINFFDVEEDEALEAASVDGAEDGGIDFFHADHTNERILVLQGHFPANAAKAAPKGKIDSLIASIALLENPASFRKAGRADIADAIEAVRDKLDVYECYIGVVSNGGTSDQIERTIAAHENNDRYSQYSFLYESRSKIVEKYRALRESDDSVAADTIAFMGNSYFEDSGDYGRAWVGSVSAAELNRLHTTHKEKLFARNVRLFLGTRKGGINEQIVTTAKESPGRFWALNNGVTIVADSIKETDSSGVFSLTRFSIVNGCQTTASLGRAGAPPGCKVLTRLVAASQAVTTDIVRFNNTQNAVRLSTVRAADPVHRTLRAAFDKIRITYAPKPDNRRYRGKSERVIQLDRLAQFLASRGDNLMQAVEAKSELFDRHYQDIFPHNLTPENAYLAWQLGTMADDARQTRLEALRNQGAADPVQTALLGVAGTYWIVHCASTMLEALNTRPHHFDLAAMDHSSFQSALRKYVTEATDLFMELAIDAYDSDEYPTVRQALRSPKFLKKIEQKLSNRVARLKTTKGKLPLLDNVAKSLPKK